MTDKEKIREEVERLKEETSIGLSEHENGVEQGRMEIIEALSLFLDFLQEEPVSEDLEKEIIKYIGFPQEVDEDISTTMIRKAARHFANWQKRKMIDKTIDFLSSLRRIDDDTINNYKKAMEESV